MVEMAMVMVEGEGNANIAARHAILKLVHFYCPDSRLVARVL